ncbi:hypothetical protein GDO86_015042 [Hymenochirus boettgeri]|uniref:Uncharacterized protein n=1 Tax=Hymenochirus boettgeri TaxID=247094 RepID=A0A8T2JZM5_9PIPI|nr:hypothetical protein GDO86_015042 [Hymenochirus boettgeri]
MLHCEHVSFKTENFYMLRGFWRVGKFKVSCCLLFVIMTSLALSACDLSHFQGSPYILLVFIFTPFYFLPFLHVGFFLFVL